MPDVAQNGDACLVGVAAPRTLYIYDKESEIWIDQGNIQGDVGEDGITPTIGENSNCFLGEIDTGKPSRGEKGDNGTDGTNGTDGIDGENGTNGADGKDGINGTNGTDGIDGEDGITPTIGENGNWFLGTTDTGKLSRGEKGDTGDTGAKVDKGEKGETGDQGPQKIKEAYFVTLNDPDNTVLDAGLEIASGGRLPIKRLEVQTEELFVLDANDNTIQFNQTGTYELIFNINAYVKKTGENFDPVTDFISVGFRKVDGAIVYAGANDWSYNKAAKNMIGIGIFEVGSIAEPFELINLTTKSIYINGGKIANTITHSYFSCPLVTILIKKLN